MNSGPQSLTDARVKTFNLSPLLIIGKRSLDKLNGSITVELKPGKGSAFYISLPTVFFLRKREMIQENEIIMCVLGIGTLAFMLFNYKQLRRTPSFNILAVGFFLLVAGWILTALEGFFWEGTLNFIEHLCYLVSAILVTIWCLVLFGGQKENR